MFPTAYWGADHYGEEYWPPIEQASGGGSGEYRLRHINAQYPFGGLFATLNSQALEARKELLKDDEIRAQVVEAIADAREAIDEPAPQDPDVWYAPSVEVAEKAVAALPEVPKAKEIVQRIDWIVHLENQQDEEDILALLLSMN